MKIDNPSDYLNPKRVLINTTLLVTDNIVVVAGSAEITLPSALEIIGKQFNIINTGTSNVLISPVSSQTISGDTNLNLTSQWDSVAFVSDSSNWVRCS